MADDDLDMLQQLLEMAEDDEALSDSSDSKRGKAVDMSSTRQYVDSQRQTENAPPNKRPKITPAKPLAQAFRPASTASRDQIDSGAANLVTQSKTGAIEKFSGLRMKNPCFPSIVLKERLSQVQFRKLSQARSSTGPDDKWATIAVLTEKGTKESAKGNAYSIWRLSDLQGTNVSLFLFGKAQTGLWKESEGSVVAVFNPEARIADSKFSMSVESEQQIVKLGTSVDMGFCRAKKKDGMPCKNAVNINACPFCDYHVQSEYNKIRSKRSECKDSHLHRAFHHANGSRLGSVGRPKMGEGGDILYSKPPTMKPPSHQQLQQRADKARKNIPGVYCSRLLAAMVPGQAPSSQRPQPASASAPSKCGPQASANPPRARHSCQSTQIAPLDPTHPHQSSSSEQQQRPDRSSSPTMHRQVGSGVAQSQAPQMLELQEDEVEWGDGGCDPALQHALAVIKAKGGLGAPDPNRPYQSRPQPSKMSTPQAGGTQHTHAAPAPRDQAVAAAVQKQTPGRGQQAECKQSGTRTSRLAQDRALSQPPAARKSDTPQGRVLAKLGLSKGGQQASKAAAALPLPSAGVSGFAAAFGSVAAGQSSKQTDTRYKDLVDDEDHERLTRVLTALEKKDEMQQRMEAITKLNVTAFQCKNCGTTSERRRPECKRHDVQRVTGTKRWWQCCHCSNRFTTVAVRLPNTRCPKCNDINMEFKAVSMARSVKDNADPAFASRDKFKARGEEHAFALSGQR